VTTQHVGVAHRDVVLEVASTEFDVTQRSGATAVEKQAGLVEIAGLAREPAKLDKCHLHLGVPTHRLDATLAKDIADVVRRAAGQLNKLVVGSGRTATGNSGLKQVAVAIQLVSPLQVGVARLLTGATKLRVEVAVVFLHSSDASHEGTESLVEPAVAGAPDLPGHGLEQFVDVGVRELTAGAVGRKAPLDSGVKVADPADLLHPVFAVVDDR
jgi:hypothetical protein